MLAIKFNDRQSLRKEFVENISRGGLFVPTGDRLELRSAVEVGVDLGFCGDQVVLRGEVVHCVPEELRSESVSPGVAVQVELTSQELHELFAPFLNFEDASAVETSPVATNGSERRDSPRHPARVHARICLESGEEIGGTTRNLSASGILFSVPLDPPEIGAAVRVTLLNSVSCEEIEIPSHVVRHIEGEAGEVPAIGVRFCPEPAEAEHTRVFLERLDASEHSRRLGGINGDVAELGSAALLQSFGQSARDGTLTLIRGNHEGRIAFSEGMLVSCRLGRVTGLKALARLLDWQDGQFEFHARVDPDLERDAPLGLEGAILDALRLVDERRRDAERCFAPAQSFVVDRDAAEAVGRERGKVEAAVVDLVSVGANVSRLLDVIPESDARIQQALADLVDLGVIRER